MARKPTPQEVAAAFDWDIGALQEFCGEVLEDANDHKVAHALWSFSRGDTELAIEFLKLADAHFEAGHLTPELRERENELLDRFDELQDEGEEEEDEDDD
jgi:hypothetical protein